MILKYFIPLSLLFLNETFSRKCVRILPEAYSKILHVQWSWIGWLWGHAFHFTVKLHTWAALALSESELLLKPMNHILDSPPNPLTPQEDDTGRMWRVLYNVNLPLHQREGFSESAAWQDCSAPHIASVCNLHVTTYTVYGSVWAFSCLFNSAFLPQTLSSNFV